jgi:predicted Holliday junction resolvase-like endonuclease
MHNPEAILLALTALERLEAARRMATRPSSGQGITLLAVVLLVVLVVLLIWVSYTRWVQRGSQTREVFAENAMRRGLGARDRQILLAIVMRSGLRRSQEVFTAVDAFDRGAIKLLTEFTRTRTLDENERLRSEIGRLRERLGFQIASPVGGLAGLGQTSSREIPPGRSVELMRDGPEGEAVLRGEVVRNDEIEFAVRLAAPIESRAGEPWRVRYYCGLSAWEFIALTAQCDGWKLVLNHSETVQFINRRRFPRVAVQGRALIAYLPFSRGGSPAGSAAGGKMRDPASPPTGPGPWMSDAPIFADGRVMELAGPGLRIETSLQVHLDDRVLVVFTLQHDNAAGVAGGWNTIAGIGRVRHCRAIDSGMSVAVELTGLSDAEIDELAFVTARLSSRREDREDESRDDMENAPTYLAGVAPELKS